MADHACNSWLTDCGQQFGGWRLDVVALLAVIGESIIEDQALDITSSRLSLLPRLMPAPHAFLRSERPARLPGVAGVRVSGIYSGTQLDGIGFFANLIHDIDNIGKLNVHEYTIVSRSLRLDQRRRVYASIGKWFPYLLWDMEQELYKPEHVQQREIEAQLLVNASAPTHLMTVVSCIASIGLLIAACALRDGIAVLAVATLSTQTTLTCAAWRWTPTIFGNTLPRGREELPIPMGDVAIRTRNGAFIIVHCDEEVARALYTSHATVDYNLNTGMIPSGMATLLLMFGVIFLGNARWVMQAAIGGTFIALNALYWLTAVRLRKYCWRIDEVLDITRKTYQELTYTQALWRVVQLTAEHRWIKDSEAIPATPAWDAWLQEAIANRGNPRWNAFARMSQLIHQGHRI